MPNKLLLAASRRRGVQDFIGSKTFTRKVAERFVAGSNLEDAMRVVRELRQAGIESILDLLGENVTNESQADSAAEAYLSSIDAIAREGIAAHVSIKLTQLGLDQGVDPTVERVQKICGRAAEAGTMVAIDMESHQYTDATIGVYRQLRGSFDNLVLCLQAYLKRTRTDIENLMSLEPCVRLCKGAYDEPPEISLPPAATKTSYRELLARLLPATPYTAIATHDEELIEFAEGLARLQSIPKRRFEFQMLYGVRRELQKELADAGYQVRVYIPFGDQWYPYLMRRLAERPANIRFFLEALLRG